MKTSWVPQEADLGIPTHLLPPSFLESTSQLHIPVRRRNKTEEMNLEQKQMTCRNQAQRQMKNKRGEKQSCICNTMGAEYEQAVLLQQCGHTNQNKC